MSSVIFDKDKISSSLQCTTNKVKIKPLFFIEKQAFTFSDFINQKDKHKKNKYLTLQTHLSSNVFKNQTQFKQNNKKRCITQSKGQSFNPFNSPCFFNKKQIYLNRNPLQKKQRFYTQQSTPEKRAIQKLQYQLLKQKTYKEQYENIIQKLMQQNSFITIKQKQKSYFGRQTISCQKKKRQNELFQNKKIRKIQLKSLSEQIIRVDDEYKSTDKCQSSQGRNKELKKLQLKGKISQLNIRKDSKKKKQSDKPQHVRNLHFMSQISIKDKDLANSNSQQNPHYRQKIKQSKMNKFRNNNFSMMNQ